MRPVLILVACLLIVPLAVPSVLATPPAANPGEWSSKISPCGSGAVTAETQWGEGEHFAVICQESATGFRRIAVYDPDLDVWNTLSNFHGGETFLGGRAAYHPVLDEWMLIYCIDDAVGGTETDGLFWRRSTDDGATWSAAVRMPISRYQSGISHTASQCTSGTVLDADTTHLKPWGSNSYVGVFSDDGNSAWGIVFGWASGAASYTFEQVPQNQDGTPTETTTGGGYGLTYLEPFAFSASSLKVAFQITGNYNLPVNDCRTYLVSSDDGGEYWTTPGNDPDVDRKTDPNDSIPFDPCYEAEDRLTHAATNGANCQNAVGYKNSPLAQDGLELVAFSVVGNCGVMKYHSKDGGVTWTAAPVLEYTGPDFPGYSMTAVGLGAGAWGARFVDSAVSYVASGASESTGWATYTFPDVGPYSFGRAQMTRSPATELPTYAFGAANGGFSNRAEFHRLTLQPGSVSGGSSGAISYTNRTVSGLVGFDVDASGQTVITRENGGPDIHTYAAGTLQGSATLDSSCLRVDGVTALPNHVSFLDCEAADPNNVESLKIRSASLGSPEQPSICGTANFCTSTINDEDLAGGQDGQYQLHTVESFHFGSDGAQFKDGSLDTKSLYAAWAFSDNSGRIGVMTYTWNNNAADETKVAYKTVDPTGDLPDDMCSITDPNGRSYLYGVSDGSGVSGVEAVFTAAGPGAFSGRGKLDVSLVDFFAGNAQTAQANAVACAEGLVLVGSGSLGKITLWDRSGSTPLLTIDGNPMTRGVALARDGSFGAWMESGGAVYIFNATNGEVVATGTWPLGSLSRMEMDATGSNLWLAGSTLISRWEIYTLTTGTSKTINPSTIFNPAAVGQGQGTPSGSLFNQTGGGGMFAPMAQGLAPVFGALGGQIFASVLVIFGFAAIGASLANGRGMGYTLGMSLGSVIGLVFAISVGLFPIAWAFVLALFLALAIGGWFFLGRGQTA